MSHLPHVREYLKEGEALREQTDRALQEPSENLAILEQDVKEYKEFVKMSFPCLQSQGEPKVEVAMSGDIETFSHGQPYEF